MDVSGSMTVPVLLILFNRPQHARRVLERLRDVRPTSLYVTIDGPRTGHPTDSINVAACEALISEIDWPCAVHSLIRTENLGCKYAVSSAISWFFEQVETGIILEDDCLPDLTFFGFCAELLDRYANDERIMHISGINLAADQRWTSDSYIFTPICHIWGWATWRRAWQQYDLTMSTYPAHRETLIAERVSDQLSQSLWLNVFDESYAGNYDTWDYQWVYSIWDKNGLGILPDRNLVTNIGFDADATHTTVASPFANLPTMPMTEIHHPARVEENVAATTYLFKTLYRPQSRLAAWSKKVKNRLSLFKK